MAQPLVYAIPSPSPLHEPPPINSSRCTNPLFTPTDRCFAGRPFNRSLPEFCGDAKPPSVAGALPARDRR